MPKLFLIKHAAPVVDSAAPASRWPLSPDGVGGAIRLAAAIGDTGLAAVYASREPKARQTALVLASALGVRVEVREGLHEHERDGHFVHDSTEFRRLVATVFQRPHEPVFGTETGREALERFAGAVERIVREAPGQDIAVVAHGTVISLFTADRCGVDGFALWQRLGLPSYVAIETPAMRLVEVVAEV